MEESFKPKSLSIRELFGDAKSFYKIPQYQRPYKWESEQVEQLWDDVFESFENNDQNYFLGSVITAVPRNEENSAYVDVVDGQQRLTTLMILFCVIRDHYPEINKHDSSNPLTIDIDIIKTVIFFNNKLSRLRLFTHNTHQSDFKTLILEEGATKLLKAPFKYDIKNDQEPKFKFVNTALIFIDKLNEIKDEKRLGSFINYLFDQVKIIRIECTSKNFAIKLFQVLNNRGMDLTSADLIKSFLLERLYSKYKDDVSIGKLKEDNFMSDWREMEHFVKQSDDISLNDLFIIYTHYCLGAAQKKSFTEELQILFEKQDPNDVIAELKKFAQNYYDLIYSSKNKIIYSFKYLRWSNYWKAILMAAITNEYKFFDELIFELRRFYYLYWIAGKTLLKVKRPSFNIIRAINSNKHINYLKAIIETALNKDKIIDAVKSNLISNVVDVEAWIKPLLILIEYDLTDQSNPNKILLDKNLHLEHILPKKYTQFNEWNHITDNIRDKWLRSIANLTLLSDIKNVEASNKAFSLKMDVYKGSYQNKTTAFRLSQKILDDFNNNKYQQKWNECSLKERRSWILSIIEGLFSIDLTNEKSSYNDIEGS